MKFLIKPFTSFKTYKQEDHISPKNSFTARKPFTTHFQSEDRAKSGHIPNRTLFAPHTFPFDIVNEEHIEKGKHQPNVPSFLHKCTRARAITPVKAVDFILY